MKFTNTIGIDVSKMTFDATIYSGQFYCQFTNSNKGFKQLLQWAENHTDESLKTTLFCFEHTGLYSQNLSTFLSKMKVSYSMVSGLALKRSVGLKRGKTDKIDSKVIAEYAFEKKHKLPLFTYPGETVLEIQRLMSLRKKMVRQRAGFMASIKEYSSVLKKTNNGVFFKSQEKLVSQLTKQIKIVENKIDQSISEDDVLKRQFDLLNSIKGVGPVIAVNILVYTAGFTKFKTWRQFACYIGTAPFEYQSGTSLKYKARLHYLGHRQIKSLIHMGACSAILSDPELKLYYENRIAKGKSKMSTLNIIRNKLIARIFAVVKNDKQYVVTHKYAA
jgi:transposase